MQLQSCVSLPSSRFLPRKACQLSYAAIVGSLILLSCFASVGASARNYQIDRQQSVFALITHRGGVAAALAHNHIIAPTTYEVTLSGEVSTSAVGEGLRVHSPEFRLAFAAVDLQPDTPELQQAWFARLQSTAVLRDALTPIKDSDRAAITKTMLSADQLDAARFPTVIAELKSLEASPSALGATAFTHKALIALDLHGHMVTTPFAVRLVEEQNQLKLEGVGSYKFTDFGIKPFSAYGGTVRNEDQFHIYVHLVAN